MSPHPHEQPRPSPGFFRVHARDGKVLDTFAFATTAQRDAQLQRVQVLRAQVPGSYYLESVV